MSARRTPSCARRAGETLRGFSLTFLVLFGVAFTAGCGGDDGTEKETSSFEGRPWVLASGVALPQDVAVDRPSATFESGTVAGSTGCNRYTGGYTSDGEALEIGQIAMTQMACPPPADAVERAYAAALARVSAWRMDDEQLVLVDADETEVHRYSPATPLGSWEVTGLLRGDAFASPLAGTELTARFGTDGTLSGTAGCNRYTASFTSEKGAVQIATPAATRMACAEPAGVMEQEANYLALLATAARYTVDGRSLELLARDGTRLVAYTRAQGG